MPVTRKSGRKKPVPCAAVFAHAKRYGTLRAYSIPQRYTIMRVILIEALRPC